MALNLQNKYPGRFDPVSADYPQGKFKNRSSPTAHDGSYMERDWLNDWAGFFGALISKAGLTPNGVVDTAQSSQVYDALMMSVYPVGSPIPWPTAVPPTGYLAMNGQSFSTSNYPLLASAYPSGTLPDLRGEFLRGWDGGRGVDTGRAILTAQGDAIREITGGFAVADNSSGVGGLSSPSGAFTLRTDTGRVPSWITGSIAGSRFVSASFNASNVVPTAPENRPRNYSFSYIVRAV